MAKRRTLEILCQRRRHGLQTSRTAHDDPVQPVQAACLVPAWTTSQSLMQHSLVLMVKSCESLMQLSCIDIRIMVKISICQHGWSCQGCSSGVCSATGYAKAHLACQMRLIQCTVAGLLTWASISRLPKHPSKAQHGGQGSGLLHELQCRWLKTKTAHNSCATRLDINPLPFLAPRLLSRK